jgi:hypothetical protein
VGKSQQPLPPLPGLHGLQLPQGVRREPLRLRGPLREKSQPRDARALRREGKAIIVLSRFLVNKYEVCI